MNIYICIINTPFENVCVDLSFLIPNSIKKKLSSLEYFILYCNKDNEHISNSKKVGTQKSF